MHLPAGFGSTGEGGMSQKVETLLCAKKIILGVLFDTVKIELVCHNDYEAQVLYDDLVERLQAGQEISIDPVAP